MLETFGTPTRCYNAGEIYDVDDTQGNNWIRTGIAKQTTTPPPHIVQFMNRLEIGAGKPCIFFPFLGEFGHLILTHIRLTHWHKASRKIVCCRPGEEVLYPSADHYVTDWIDPIPDSQRVGTGREPNQFDWSELAKPYPNHEPIAAGHLTPEQELIALHPDKRIPFQPRHRGLTADVLLGVRRRDFCPVRNWTHWQTVADALSANGISFAVIGQKPTSFDLHGQTCHTGDHDTDAAIELMQQPYAVYVGTDTGTSHLAATTGCNMIVFRETWSRSRNLFPRMEEVNPGRIQVIPNGWDDADAVTRAIIERVENVRELETKNA